MKTLSFKSLAPVLLQLFILTTTQHIYGQEELPEAKPEIKNFKNSIRVNLTNPMIFGKNCYMIGYERTIGDHQSFSVNIGRFAIPKLASINTDSVEDISNNMKSKGFHFSGDYRFYLSKENKFKSPHGVYIGPYMTYNYFSRNYLLSANTQTYTGEMNADFSFRIASVGFQMGYQFVFWNRVTLDMLLFGPGIAAYKISTILDSNLDPESEAELFRKINEALKEKIPGYDLVLEPGAFERTGSYKTTSLGFRYIIMLGIRF